MKKKPNFEKVSVSLPPEVHEWLKKEAQSRTQTLGENWSASRIVQEAIREYRARRSTPMLGQAMPDLNEKPLKHTPVAGPEILIPHKQSAGGSSTAPNTRYRKAGKAK